jgi:hypothetical protein
MANVTNYAKHGYFHGIKDLPARSQMKIFCGRRSAGVVKSFGSTLNYNDMLARVYYQGLQDGMDLKEGVA